MSISKLDGSNTPVEGNSRVVDVIDDNRPVRYGLGMMNVLGGMVVFLLGLFLILQNTMIYTSFSLMGLVGFNPPFGLVLLPMLAGVGIVFFNKKALLGWILTAFGIITILLGILMGLRIDFRPVTLYYAILMYGMTTAGIGLILKGFFAKKS